MAFECSLTNWIQSNWTGAHCAQHFVCHFRNVYFWDQFTLHTVKICFIVKMFRWRIYAYRKSRCALFQQNINLISVSFKAHGCAMFIDMYAQKPHFVPGCCCCFFFLDWLSCDLNMCSKLYIKAEYNGKTALITCDAFGFIAISCIKATDAGSFDKHINRFVLKRRITWSI